MCMNDLSLCRNYVPVLVYMDEYLVTWSMKKKHSTCEDEGNVFL